MQLIHSSSSSIIEMTSLFFSSPASSHISLKPRFSEIMMEENVKNAELIITKWDIDSPSMNKLNSLFHTDRKEAKQFLRSIKDLCRAMKFLMSQKSDILVLAQNLYQIAMKRLEKEFHQILSDCNDKLDLDSITDDASSSTLDEAESEDRIKIDGSSLTSASSMDETMFEDEIKLGGSFLRSASSSTLDEILSEDKIKIDGSGPIPEFERSSSSSSMVALSDLKLIADCMISCGYAKECVNIFTLMRKSTVEESLNKLGIQRFKSSRVHKTKWKSLEDTVKLWLRAVTVAVKSFFNREKFLCQHVFSTASVTIRESCFRGIVKNSAIKIFRFAEHVADKKRSPENIFRLMEIYETISDLWPEIDLLFCHELTFDIKSQALSSLRKLANAIHLILTEFESNIKKDSCKTSVPGGGIHELSQSATNYISSLSAYAKTLSDVLTIHPSVLSKTYFEPPASDDPTTQNASTHLAWLISVLLSKIDTKAASYKDVALSYLFLANNLHFIVEKVLTSNLQDLLGDEWVKRHVKKVRIYSLRYENLSWNRVFSSLQNKKIPLSSEEANECFRKFNVAFDEAYRKQIMWTVPDGLLRDEIKLSIAKRLVPAYREFFEIYIGVLTEETKNVIRFIAPLELENYLSNLFRGSAVL
jgi:exocyst complex protein 7